MALKKSKKIIVTFDWRSATFTFWLEYTSNEGLIQHCILLSRTGIDLDEYVKDFENKGYKMQYGFRK